MSRKLSEPHRSRLDRRPERRRIDEIDTSIIVELQKDGRRSYTAIANKVGCPRPRSASGSSA